MAAAAILGGAEPGRLSAPSAGRGERELVPGSGARSPCAARAAALSQKTHLDVSQIHHCLLKETKPEVEV